jgi:dTDP-4-amino-4,6-dideoxygalactose transaminase
MSERVIPLAEPHLVGNASAYLEECLRSNYVSSVGPFVERFEQAFAEYVGAAYAVACSSGTAAIHVALRVLGVGPSDEVFVPTLTFIASANAVTYLGARTTLVDSEPTTWNLDPTRVIDEIRGRATRGQPLPKAIEVVHLLGHPADVEPIVNACAEHGVAIVEDAAEALGARYRGGALDDRHVGTIGRMGCFSFNGNKIITTGGGGMIVTDDERLARHARHLTTQARLPGLAYQHDEVGYNYRLSNLGAALGLSQLEVLTEFVVAKRRIADAYDAAFGGNPAIEIAPRTDWAEPSRWLYSIRFKDRSTARRVLDGLVGAGIGARPVWTPLHEMPPYQGAKRLGDGSVAASVAATAVSLPSSVGLSEADQSWVIARVLATVGGT